MKYTGSKKAAGILDKFEEYLPKFKKIIPVDYKRMLELTQGFLDQGMSLEDAKIAAFYADQKKSV